MNRSLHSMVCAALVASLLPLFGAMASAQSSTYRPVRRGDVTGVELQLDGPLHVVRGTRLRWAMTAYEVVGLDGLRPAGGAEVHVATSLEDEEAKADATTDVAGRVLVEIPIPEDAPDHFGTTIQVHARRGVSRRFELRVRTSDPRQLQLWASPQVTSPGHLPVFGRFARHSGQAYGDAAVHVQVRDARGPLGPEAHLRTDANGVFHHTFRVPREVQGAIQIQARSDADDRHRAVSATAQSRIAQATEPAIVVQVKAPPTARPRERVPVEVVVRRADGRPVAGARVRLGGRPVPLTREEEERDRRYPFETADARGRVTLSWQVPDVRSGWQDAVVAVQAGLEGVGRGGGNASVRVSPLQYAARVSAEGGALVPGLGARVFARVVRIDGHPAPAGVTVRTSGGRLGDLQGTTDAHGVAILEGRVGDAPDGDRCGGDAATALDLSIEGQPATQHCLAVDPDAAARVQLSPALASPGQEIQVQVERVRDANNMPVFVTALHRVPEGLEVVATGVIAPRADQFTFTLPDDCIGEVIVRARPLVGRETQEVRGGASMLLSRPVGAPRVVLEAASGGPMLPAPILSTTPEPVPTVVSFALPIEAITTFEHALRALEAAPLGDPRVQNGSAVAAVLAERTPSDLGAPAVLRGQRAEPAPEPQNPERLGLLRDPWRASHRFVQGRLALVFRAIEARVDAAVPEQLDEIAVIENGRFSFNRQLLASLTSGLGSEGATGLGGEPLTIERLESLDRNFRYDAVARRITRRRLFKLLLAMRQFVQSNALDLAWTRPGDATLWMERLRHQHAPGLGGVRPGELVDGWGRPFELRATARPRFSRVQPVDGYELVSAGPDGRFGNGDDVYDPTARVLPNGSLYAQAVDEESLVARLRGVELGRATVEMAAQAFGTPRTHIPAPSESASRSTNLGNLPSLLHPDPHALGIQRPTRPASGRLGVARGATSSEIQLNVGSEPRTWRTLGLVFTQAGAVSLEGATSRAGAAILSDLDVPRRLRVGESLRVPIHLTNVSAADGEYALRASAEGIDFQIEPTVRIPAGETRTLDVIVTGQAPGRHEARVDVTRGEQVVRGIARRVWVDRGLHPIRRRAAALVDGEWEVDFPLPADAQDVRARVVAMSPAGLVADPDLRELRENDPALVAWAETLTGRSVDPEVEARLFRQQDPSGLVMGDEPALSTAAAIVAWSAALDDEGHADPAAQSARARAIGRLGGLPPLRDTDGNAGRIRMQSSTLAALATSGVSDSPRRQAHHDPVSQTLASWLPQLRRVLRDAPAEPSLLARAAAALLLADPRDGHGRAMFAKALESLEDGRVVPSEARRTRAEVVSATLALALAAHQVGQTERARSLVRAAASDAPTFTRRGGEPAFWWLACGSYGALGATTEPETPTPVEVRAGRTRESIVLASGRGAVELPLSAGARRTVTIRTDRPIFARVEAVFGRPFARDDEGPLGLSVAGEAGDLGEVAAFELTVRAREAVAHPVVLLQLPAGVREDDALLRAIASSGAVRTAVYRHPGFVQLELMPLPEEAEHTFPLPLRWRVGGQVRGMAIVAHPADRPDAMTVLPPRRVDL